MIDRTNITEKYGPHGCVLKSAMNMPDKAKFTKRKAHNNFQIAHASKGAFLINIPRSILQSLSKTQDTKTQNSSTFTLKQSLWSKMIMSLRLLIVIVISCMTEFAAASNGSAKNGGAVSGLPRSNSIPKDGPYKSAQSAASVSNIVNGHYETIAEDDNVDPVSIMSESSHFASTVDDNDEGYWREVKAIIGGVLGFWGGIGSLGTLFLVVVMSKRYCCRDVDDKEGDKDG